MTQFPKDIISTATIYPYYKDKETGEEVAVRCVLKGCFWALGSNATKERTGLNTNFKAKLIIPHIGSGKEYIFAREWYNLSRADIESGKYWTVDDNNYPLMMNFESEHEFEWALSNAQNRVEAQISEFMKKPNVFKALEFDEKRWGTNEPSNSMWHYILRC